MQVPPIIQKLLSPFPLYTYPPIPPPSDVECLKWQAYLALRGLDHICVRTDIDPQGAVDVQLPNLWDGKQLTAARELPAWVDTKVSIDSDGGLEGYKNEAARDESRAWVALLEGRIHAALLLVQPTSASFSLVETKSRPIESILAPPPAPLSGLTSLIPPFGTRIPHEVIQSRYREAIGALSERLGTDKWFLSSEYVSCVYSFCGIDAR
ncbi:hypothetical protein DFS33DRAFT_1296687 [Desarmillaria ectypa]|nr:hypothetical protein DFS33DRAFT_1296687 [Desarmillaria ectypa]